MEKWEILLNTGRRKDKAKQDSNTSKTANGRLEMERDYDRVLFATPTRRLADKTQVFPLDRNDSIRTRLTHSLEVSAIARSIGLRLAYESPEIFAGIEDQQFIQRSVPALLAAIGLVHDMGNPPFGHQGESAIQTWFNKNCQKVFNVTQEQAQDDVKDFLKFDGNAQTFRLLTRLQILSDQFGLNLTYATLAALIKYPVGSNNTNPSHWKKHGFFKSEEEIVNEIWANTGLKNGIRHPLTYIMEACDDIAYSVMDAEDTVKKGLASFSDLANYLEQYNSDDNATSDVLEKAKQKHEEFKKTGLSPQEINDCSMQMFRVYAITNMVESVVNFFKEKTQELTNGELHLYKGIIPVTPSANLCKTLKEFDKRYGFKHKSVLELELKGHNFINKTMDMLWVGIHGKLENTYDSQTPFGKYVYSRISESYRRVFEDKSNTLDIPYKEAQLLSDSISGMTDSYLIALHDELLPLYENHC
ncbi:dNTP triphosphohydrolase [Azotobacter chroococcum subsp. isscasi]|uniref:dGTP triphosphohydrolase n=1 Tax=Azotobacter chroococcum TaxID=353 RepID=UPI00103AA5F7|nr:dNTP triphosphohydrolase [Azotobacter chroococcum]TBW10997.1 dNTP triphosphohydrolase [Azotobacter chroococcum subsp. isscasi]